MTNSIKNIAASADVVQLLEMPNGGSDLSLKKNIAEIDSVLEKVLSLRPITWNWKTDPEGEHIKYGFIAQEVEALFPDLVQEKVWEDGTMRKYLSTNDLIPYLIAALKEQREQITDLQKKLNS